jgi:N-acetylglucosamine-6-phosphate deacetylase
MAARLAITNCLPAGAEEEVTIEIADGAVTAVRPSSARRGAFREGERGDGRTIDAEGRTVLPGFVDLHVQGAGGADVLDGTEEALSTVARTCARFGVCGFLATTVYRPGGDNSHLAAVRAAVGRDLGGARLLGAHLEGPFISPVKRGMILPDCVCPPSPAVMDDIERLAGGSLRMMTIAPELEGGIEMIRRLSASGVIASFGHSNATYEQTLKGIDAGISHVTHLFNAMPSLHHRSPGPLVALFKAQGPTVQIIPDGVHLHHRMVKFAFELLGADRCVTITDGLQAMGLPEGTYVYNGVQYESRGGAARYRDGTLIGTTLGMIDLVLRFMEYTGCSLDVAASTASVNPARVLGLGTAKGALAAGIAAAGGVSADGVSAGDIADLVLLDHDYSVWATVVGGKVVYRKAR